jgi:4-amino-4-deoxy-L-arabinose transferase-like glycosyltransferase
MRLLRHYRVLALVCLLLLAFSRWHGLGGFPVFIDEAYLLERMTPFIRRGSIFVDGGFNRMLIAWVSTLLLAGGPYDLTLARLSVTLINLVGAAAAMSTARLIAGGWAALTVGLLLITLPYEMFFGRLLLPDSTVASSGMLAVWCAVVYARTLRSRWAVGVGLSLALALVAKPTGLLLLPIIGLPLVLTTDWRAGLRGIALGSGGFLAVWVPLYAVTVWRGHPYLGNLSLYGRVSFDLWTLELANIQTIAEMFAAWLGLPLIVLSLLLIALGLFVRPRATVALLGVLAAALGGVILTVTAFRSRYVAFAFPLWALLVGTAVGGLLAAPQRAARALGALGSVGLAVWMLTFALPFHVQYARDSSQLRLWRGDEMEYLASDASGFGLREALALVEARAQPNERILGVVSNCIGLRVMASQPARVECVTFRYDPGSEAVVGQQVNAAVAQQTETLWLIYEETFLTKRDSWQFEYEVIAQFPRPAEGLPVWVIRVQP